MSNEFKDRLARGQLTSTEDYQRMKDALHEMKKNDPSEDAGKDPKDSQEWKNWDLSPVQTVFIVQLIDSIRTKVISN